MARMPSDPPPVPADVIDSWKGIAAYLGRDVSTVMRWERNRGLPVHRLPGGRKASVYALKPELDRWRGSGCPPPAEPAPAHVPSDAVGTGTTPSIAVLPFANLTPDRENQYFGDGLADEIITTLCRVTSLRVIARTSSFAFRGKAQDVRRIGEALGATCLLEGSVQRAGERARVSLQLINCSDGSHLWADRCDCDLRAPFAAQQEIARLVAEVLNARMQAAPKSGRATVPEAYEAWLNGRYHQLNFRTMRDSATARDCFSRALVLDPTFGPAHLAISQQLLQSAGLGIVPPLQVQLAVRSGIERALQWDDGSGEAHAALGKYRALFEFDWAGAREAFNRALECEPGSAGLLRELSAWLLTPTGRLAEAEEAASRAVALDPLSPLTHFVLAQLHFCRRDYERSRASIETAIDLGGGIPMLEWLSGVISALQGRFDEAAATCERAADRMGATPMLTAGLGMVYGWAGRHADATRVLQQIERASETTYVSPICQAWVHLGLGAIDAAFGWLDRAVDGRDPHVLLVPVKPHYDALRGDSRFDRLLEKMHLSPVPR